MIARLGTAFPEIVPPGPRRILALALFGLGCAGASPARAGAAEWLNCRESDVSLSSVGTAAADAERATQGYVCLRPGEATGAAERRADLGAWVGPFGGDAEKNTFGLTDGGMRNGDTDE
jgi:hypothetical protein